MHKMHTFSVIDIRSIVELLMQMVSINAASITRAVSNFKTYAYDCTSNNCIEDGGGDMYDTGNKVKYPCKDMFTIGLRGSDYSLLQVNNTVGTAVTKRRIFLLHQITDIMLFQKTLDRCFYCFACSS